MRVQPSFWHSFTTQMARFYLTRWKKFRVDPPSLFKHPQISLVFVQPGEMVAATCVFEGTGEEVETQRNSLFGLAREFDGIRAPDENGQFGYRLTFAIAYLRV